MGNFNIGGYIGHHLDRANPSERHAEIIDPLLPTARDRRVIARERVGTLFTDYGHGKDARRSGRPLAPRALSDAERLVASMHFHAPILSQRFRSSIGQIIRSHTGGVSADTVADSSFLLVRLPLLEHDLIKTYHLQGEKKAAESFASGYDTISEDHHHLPHSMGGVDSVPNLVRLPKRFHATLHTMVVNLPPHLWPLLVLAWSEYDPRSHVQQAGLRRDIYDFYRDTAKGQPELEEIYNPKVLYRENESRGTGGKSEREKATGIKTLRRSL